MASFDELRTQLARIGGFLTAENLLQGPAGNISARLVEGEKWFAVVKARRRLMGAPEAFCRVDQAGNVIEPPDARPSTMSPVHLAIYSARPDVNAIVHGCGAYTDAVAAALGRIPDRVETFWALGGQVQVVGPDEIRVETLRDLPLRVIDRVVAPHLSRGVTAAVVPFLGTWVVGSSIDEAYHRTRVLENIARTEWCRLTLGSALGRQVAVPEAPSWLLALVENAVRGQGGTG